jgi:hypothetical protein
MSDPPKRTISAKLILNDIQAGMDESEVKRKFKLSDKGYQSVIQKLSEMGLLKAHDLHSGVSAPEQVPKLTQPEVPLSWRCPSCGTPQTRAYEECPHCGVIVAKFSAMSLERHPHGQSHDHRIHAADSGLPARWPIIAAAILAFLVVGVATLKWSSNKRTKASIGTSASIPGSVRSFAATSFEQEVREASKTMPVLVMFHADW